MLVLISLNGSNSKSQTFHSWTGYILASEDDYERRMMYNSGVLKLSNFYGLRLPSMKMTPSPPQENVEIFKRKKKNTSLP